LVTPTSQIVGVQAVQNVLLGRYKIVSKEARDYVYGGYGRPPAQIAPEVQKVILKNKEPITCRPADLLEPELEKAKEESKEFARNIQDVLIYALYPTTGARFLKYKYGIDKTVPDDWKPPYAPGSLKEVNRGKKLVNRVEAGKSKND